MIYMNEMNKILYLVRGVPGSGKTTFAHTIVDDEHVFSADDYFMVDGEYRFDASKLKDAHADCKNRCEAAMKNSVSKIAVANTFTRDWEMEGYLDLAEKHGYVVFSLIVENRHGNKNVHNVPDDVIEKMKKRFSIKL